jgi:hypothetical protein
MGLMDMKKRLLLTILVLLGIHPGAGMADVHHNLAFVAGAHYLCQSANQAREQDINPDYLVPGCQLYPASMTAKNTSPKPGKNPKTLLHSRFKSVSGTPQNSRR